MRCQPSHTADKSSINRLLTDLPELGRDEVAPGFAAAWMQARGLA
jgi:hypothetical protein